MINVSEKTVKLKLYTCVLKYLWECQNGPLSRYACPSSCTMNNKSWLIPYFTTAQTQLNGYPRPSYVMRNIKILSTLKRPAMYPYLELILYSGPKRASLSSFKDLLCPIMSVIRGTLSASIWTGFASKWAACTRESSDIRQVRDWWYGGMEVTTPFFFSLSSNI